MCVLLKFEEKEEKGNKKITFKRTGFNLVLVSSVKFSKYSSCMSKLIIAKHFPWTYVFFYTYFTDGYTQAQCISTQNKICS